MGKYIIDAESGTVVRMETCFIIDADDLGNDAFLSDSEIAEVGRERGISVADIVRDTGYGDNKYRYTVSYSPLSVRDEADSLLDGGVYDDPEDAEYKKALEWARDTATQEELTEISEYAMGHDHVWDGFRENLIDSVIWIYDNRTGKK